MEHGISNEDFHPSFDSMLRQQLPLDYLIVIKRNHRWDPQSIEIQGFLHIYLNLNISTLSVFIAHNLVAHFQANTSKEWQIGLSYIIVD